ncbi:MAG: ATP-dependent DNA helicase RecG [Gemmatimonadota bacterium]|jgi:ATP-dependent DNA helicase RecG|nr:ATP-dependent DNA helicase RecG [Gemmatimonadota bacterium]
MSRFNILDWETQYIRGVGPRRAKLLEKLELRTARDLLYHTPRRYEDASTITPIGQLRTGELVTTAGRVVSKGILPNVRRLRVFQAVIQDQAGRHLECVWPGQPFLDRMINLGDLLLVTGPVRFFHGNQLQPREFTILASVGETLEIAEGIVYPIYPATEGLPHWQLLRIISDTLEQLLDAVKKEDFLPADLVQETGLPALELALRWLHQPPSAGAAEQGRRRLALEELFALQVLHAQSRREVTTSRVGISFPRGGTLVPRLMEALPFSLTRAQRRVLGEIGADMAAPTRMHRLLQGDVGAGKTVVALLAALRAIENGFQVALMVPTELLAEQHVRTLTNLGAAAGIEPVLLTGRLAAPARRASLEKIASGEAPLVVGTHALIQESVRFHRLGLVIIDEQHRFGVRQRLALTSLGENPDVLVMSATPIPRSLALTIYGDLEISVLDERPPGRTPIATAIRTPGKRSSVYTFVREEVAAGRQAYIVYPIIEENEELPLAAATAEFDRLTADVFPDLRLALLHGQMPAAEKDAVMRGFAAGEIDILVSTTVIEVGIDVPNATVMVIENAERFGLSQLHQLRGRVGRGGAKSYCILITEATGSERLKVFSGTDDGFRIAEADLRLRGQGDLFGSRQSGVPGFRWARLELDADLVGPAREAATKLVEEDPTLENHPELRAAIERSWAERKEMYVKG